MLFKTALILFVPALRLLLGCYIKISDSKYVCFFLKIYCVIFPIGLTFLEFYCIDRYAIGHIAIIEYLISVVFSLITAQDYLITFSKHLKTSDAIIGFKKLPLIKLDFLLPILVTFFVKSVLLSGRLKEGRKLLIVGLVGITDTNPIIISLILSSLYTRMVKIRERFDSNFVPINIVGKEQVSKNVRVVKKCLGYYNNLLDGMNRIDRTLQFLVRWFYIVCFFFV